MVDQLKAPTTAGACVLIVVGSPDVQDMMVGYFRQPGVDAIPASGRREMLRHLTAAEPNLIILDLRPGDEDSLNLLHEIRSRSDIPVIIVSGRQSNDIDRIIGLSLAPTIMSRNASPAGIAGSRTSDLAAVGRGEGDGGAESRTGRFRFSGWQLERRTRRLTDPKGNMVSLTKGE